MCHTWRRVSACTDRVRSDVLVRRSTDCAAVGLGDGALRATVEASPHEGLHLLTALASSAFARPAAPPARRQVGSGRASSVRLTRWSCYS